MTSEPRPLKVFLAHSHHDKPMLRDLYSLLRLDGFDPWFDERSLVGGQDWEYEIKKRVTETDVVTVFLSKHCVDRSGYIQKELSLALDVAQRQPEGSIFVIPIRHEGCQVPERVKHLHCVDVQGSEACKPRCYLDLQQSLVHRASQLGLVQQPEEAITHRQQFGAKWGMITCLDVAGGYLVRGKSPEGRTYYGTADIRQHGAQFTLTANVGGRSLVYVGQSSGTMLDFVGDHSVSYSLRDDNTLVGQWGNGGVEELIPASPFSNPNVAVGMPASGPGLHKWDELQGQDIVVVMHSATAKLYCRGPRPTDIHPATGSDK
jgi:hypothetical protein